MNLPFLLNLRFQTRADKGQIRGKFQNEGRQIKGKILINKGQIAVALVITIFLTVSRPKLLVERVDLDLTLEQNQLIK